MPHREPSEGMRGVIAIACKPEFSLGKPQHQDTNELSNQVDASFVVAFQPRIFFVRSVEGTQDRQDPWTIQSRQLNLNSQDDPFVSPAPSDIRV
jgi:hypothetical protein